MLHTEVTTSKHLLNRAKAVAQVLCEKYGVPVVKVTATPHNDEVLLQWEKTDTVTGFLSFSSVLQQFWLQCGVSLYITQDGQVIADL